MPKYNVHVYTIVRVKVPDIEAASPECAAELAGGGAILDWYKLFDIGANIEWAEMHYDFLVDEIDEKGRVRTVRLDKNYKEVYPCLAT